MAEGLPFRLHVDGLDLYCHVSPPREGCLGRCNSPAAQFDGQQAIVEREDEFDEAIEPDVENGDSSDRRALLRARAFLFRRLASELIRPMVSIPLLVGSRLDKAEAREKYFLGRRLIPSRYGRA
jgi:hypothetical protein